jgi:hypothetical protein
MEEKAVKIELTLEQREKLEKETGKRVSALRLDLIGQITVTAQRTVQLGVEGQPLWSGANPGVFTAANGDAIFWAANGVAGGPGAFLITGGKGRFAGAVGSGAVSVVTDATKGEATWSWVGMISRPKP